MLQSSLKLAHNNSVKVESVLKSHSKPTFFSKAGMRVYYDNTSQSRVIITKLETVQCQQECQSEAHTI
jgi:hypothetical protein